ncbi:hypothetical protein PHLGIDRAFT_120548 [Phlebiopsis gigantea 11061_1 CR5-6]|uniref:Peptidase S9 prolyl oligopeptidase catalytic domain-containing protein n=1 Tax=Phlebiopsis gigantea (strain 11061_1 CR5-6) TaxID=745531 RepID=A0A0C3PG05_PHLG1|nr:hypothetical protein PHLGIDRAFT_120548 [Phlebiopsis gigantea 11061_1 CR5-6]
MTTSEQTPAEKSKSCVPYGRWNSPITVDVIAKEVVGFGDLIVDSSSHRIYHLERRPEDARFVLVDTEKKRDVSGKDFNVRCVINAYGGRPAVAQDSSVYFTNFPDLRVYQLAGNTCKSVSPIKPEWRYGDITIHPTEPLLVCVLEDNTDPTPTGIRSSLAVINVNSCSVNMISEGWDFYADPAVSPDGKSLAFTRWNHPDSAFHSMQLVAADVILENGRLRLANETIVAGEPGHSIAQQPQWLSNNTLLFVFDVSGWGQLWTYTMGQRASPVLSEPIREDFSEAHWYHGLSSYAILNEDQVLCATLKDGSSRLYLLDIRSGALHSIPNPYVNMRQFRKISNTSAVLLGSTNDQGEVIVRLSLSTSRDGEIHPQFEVLARSNDIELAPSFIPRPRHLLLTDKRGRDLHAFLYSPTSPHSVGLPDEKPPAVISFHSGPNSRRSAGFDWMKVLYTSRGWAWIDVMFGGTVGFGREYQERLNGLWGILDVDDCAEGTRQIAERGLIDVKRVVIRGGTSGGYGVLRSCVLYPDLYSAGVSLCGVADLRSLQEKVLKFQLHYIQRLVGGEPDEIPDVYKERSPLYTAENIRTPLLLVHGRLDQQVPVEQTETIAEAVRATGGRAELIIFEDEAHGFYKAKNVKAAYQAELDLYEEIFGFSTK